MISTRLDGEEKNKGSDVLILAIKDKVRLETIIKNNPEKNHLYKNAYINYLLII